jgi:dihydroorotase
VSKFTAGPCDILGLPYGTLSEGAEVDVTVLDLDCGWTVDVCRFRSKSRNCPFNGWQCQGRPVGTIVGGRWVYSECLGTSELQ